MRDQLVQPPVKPEIQVLGTAEYLQSLIGLGVEVPNPAGLQGSLDALLQEHGIEVAFLNDKPKEALLLTAVAAQNLSDNEPSDYERGRRQVVAQAILGSFPKDEVDNTPRRQAAIDRFTNRELSGQLAGVMGGALFDGVREGLGVSGADIAKDIDLRVLDIAAGHEPSGLPNLLGFDREDMTLYENHLAELRKRTKTYITESGSSDTPDTLAPAWMRDGHGGEKNIIFITALTAESIIAQAETYGAEQSQFSELPKLRHELVHCFDALSLEDGFYGIGLLLEERRAERYSGDQNGYLDVKQAVDFIFGSHGTSLDEVFPKDGTYSPGDTYLKLATALGLEDMLDLATALPESYEPLFKQDGGFSADYVNSGNGINDALLRILRRAKASHGDDYAQSLVSKYVDRWVQRLKAEGIELENVPDNVSFGPMVLAILAIKDFRQRYPGHNQFDWSGTYGDNWAIEI